MSKRLTKTAFQGLKKLISGPKKTKLAKAGLAEDLFQFICNEEIFLDATAIHKIAQYILQYASAATLHDFISNFDYVLSENEVINLYSKIIKNKDPDLILTFASFFVDHLTLNQIQKCEKYILNQKEPELYITFIERVSGQSKFFINPIVVDNILKNIEKFDKEDQIDLYYSLLTAAQKHSNKLFLIVYGKIQLKKPDIFDSLSKLFKLDEEHISHKEVNDFLDKYLK